MHEGPSRRRAQAAILRYGREWEIARKKSKAFMADAARKDYWNSTWGNLPPCERYQGPVFEHDPVLSKFLAKAGGGEAIEVGCVPGNYMSLCRPLHCVFFQFVPPRRYDLVFSQGFVEHFDDYKLVVQKHEALAAPGGLVVIIVPNLTHLHRVLCGHFAPEILSVHRFPLMHAEVLRKTLEDTGLEVMHCEYHRTFRPPYRLPRPVDLCSRAVQKGLRVLPPYDIGNRFASPYLISISRKPSHSTLQGF